MSREGYKPGDHWVIDDRTGQKVRASETKREWNGLLVHKSTWEPRHPQDLVRGRIDRMTVQNPRPRPTDSFIGPLATETTEDAAAGAQSLTVDTSERMSPGDSLSIMLDSGDTFRTTLTEAPDSVTINVSPSLPGPVSAGARVFNNTGMSDPEIG